MQKTIYIANRKIWTRIHVISKQDYPISSGLSREKDLKSTGPSMGDLNLYGIYVEIIDLKLR